MQGIQFSYLLKPVFFENCPLLFQEIQSFFYLWPYQEIEFSSFFKKNTYFLVKSLDDESKGYEIQLQNEKKIFEPTITSALCSLGIELVMAFCQENSHILCLHAAGIKIKQNNILILGDNKAGKSTLITKLMALGYTNLGDDLIGITPAKEIFCFGLPPRLRLPLPFSKGLENFVKIFQGIYDNFYQYVYAPCSFVVPFGVTFPITNIILLQRKDDCLPQLKSLSLDSSLSEMLSHYVMLEGSAELIFKQAVKLIENFSVLVFQYSDLDKATNYLENFFLQNECALIKKQKDIVFDKQNNYFLSKKKRHGILIKNNKHKQYVQANDIGLVVQYGKTFLMDKNLNAVYELNLLGEVLWKLLENPLCEKEAVLLLSEAFPQINKIKIMNDVSQFFRLFKRKNLIRCI